MRTRRKLYSSTNPSSFKLEGEEKDKSRRKRKRLPSHASNTRNFFDCLTDEILLLILGRLSFTATSPSDFISALLTCKRWSALVRDPLVLSKVSPRVLAVKASKWSESAHGFLRSCVEAGNLDASYLLGMIHFYCLEDRRGGIALLSRAAVSAHAPALYALAVIQFNGSGGSKKDKDLRTGAALCARAASLGHVAALRELGYCLQDGYGVRLDPEAGRRCLMQANARELAAFLAANRRDHFNRLLVGGGSGWAATSPTSDVRYDVPAGERDAMVRVFMEGWWREHVSRHVRCSGSCGRVETRRHEFRRCSVCGKAKYCSRACQSRDWKGTHSDDCATGGVQGERVL